MKNKSEDKRYTLKTLIITNIIIALIATFINYSGELIKYFLTSNNLELEYKILSSNIFSKKEIEQAIKAKFVNLKIDYSFDDNFISEYHLTKVELKNVGPFIKDELFIDVNFNNENVKILSILGKSIEPYVKEIELEYNKPPFIWNPFEKNEDTLEVGLYFRVEEPGAYMVAVYRSYNKEVGFGKINPKILKKNEYKDYVLKGERYWYRIGNFSSSGLESPHIGPIAWPAVLFNKPSFKDVEEIFLSDIEDYNARLDSIFLKYRVLKTENPNTKIYVDVIKSDFIRWREPDELDYENTYFKEDIRFLNGKSSIFFNNFSKNGIIRLWIISKSTSSNFINNLSLEFSEAKDIEITRASRFYDNEKLKSSISKKKKSLKEKLTPYQTKIFNGENKIIITWTIPNYSKYKFVRIFKTKINPNHKALPLNWDNEIYEGKGEEFFLFSNVTKIIKSNNNILKENFSVVLTQNQLKPPPRRRRTPIDRPSAPSGMKIYGPPLSPTIVNLNENKIMPYFEDYDIIDGHTYSYVLVAYDNHDNYSFPIETRIKATNKGLISNISGFLDYKNSKKLLEISYESYTEFNYLDKASFIMSLLDTLQNSSSLKGKTL